jgi:hypothetical protein
VSPVSRPRSPATRLAELLRAFPAVLVVGPRQCGKRTLVRHLRPAWTHLDLERPADLGLLTADLEGFLRRHPARLAVSDTLASVLRSEPDWNRLPADTPAAIRRLLRRCLQKDRHRRLQSVGTIRKRSAVHLQREPRRKPGLVS